MVNFYQLLEAIEQSWGILGAGAIGIAQDTGRILIGFRSDSVAKPNLCWSTFGGAIKGIQGETTMTPEAGATKEFIEETGYGGKILKKKMLYFYPGDEKRIPYYTYAFVVEREFHPELNWENSDYKWVTLDELLVISPKHFGLNILLDNATKKIKEIIKKKDLLFLIDKKQ